MLPELGPLAPDPQPTRLDIHGGRIGPQRCVVGFCVEGSPKGRDEVLAQSSLRSLQYGPQHSSTTRGSVKNEWCMSLCALQLYKAMAWASVCKGA